MEENTPPALLQTLTGARGEVSCADVAGGWMVAGAGPELRVWRWVASAGWTLDGRTRAHRYGVTSARWTAGGTLLASAGIDGCARVWNRALASRATLAAPGAAAARALCWAGGGRLLVGHDDGALRVWLVPRATLLSTLRAHAGALHAVAAPHPLLLTVCTEGVLKAFELSEVCRSRSESEPAPAPLTWVDGAHDLGALCADAAEDGVAATGGHDALVRVWRAARGGLVAAETLAGHAAAVTALRWARAADGRALLASASLDRSARLWVPAGGVCLHVVHAHARYLTCVAVDIDLRFIVTGSNDKTVRTFSLGSLSLEDELEPPCAALAHFALGDLEGIGPVAETADGAQRGAEGAVRREWCEQAHGGAINCLDELGDVLATASSDGVVKVLRWSEEEGALVLEHSLEAHQYPALAVSLGACGALLASAGLDGRAVLWDVAGGVLLRELAACGETGAGGVRGARLSPHRAPLLLLATDEGAAPLWALADATPDPLHTYCNDGEAMMCCAWSADGRLLALGAESGALRLHAPPPAARLLHQDGDAHDLGVQSCDFAPTVTMLDLPSPERSYLLASGGCDGTIKLWFVVLDEDDAEGEAHVRPLRTVEAHGGGVTSVRWRGTLLASAGADRWARVWRATGGVGEDAELVAVCCVPAAAARGALAVSLLAGGGRPLLAVGTLDGELSLWRLPADDLDDDATSDDQEGTEPRFWSEVGVARWLREYVTRAPGGVRTSGGGRAVEARLEARAAAARLTGARLLDDDLGLLLDQIAGDADDSEDMDEKMSAELTAQRTRLAAELRWLRRPPAPRILEKTAPHALLCAMTHRLLREPARAADGVSYERSHVLEWLAAEGAVSPLSARRLSSTRVVPNYALRDQLRAFLCDTGYYEDDRQ